jgi:hypothetical protein
MLLIEDTIFKIHSRKADNTPGLVTSLFAFCEYFLLIFLKSSTPCKSQ